MGGNRVVFHPGAYMKREPQICHDIALEQMKSLMKDIDNEGLGDLIVCPETMGKLGQYGTIDEVLDLCDVDERIIPCFDFGHIYARSLGAIDSYEQFCQIFDRIADRIGTERMRKIHIHFSQIEFTKSGEKQHHTFESDWGPHYEYLMRAIFEKKAEPVIICESAGTMAEDAAKMKKIYYSLCK